MITKIYIRLASAYARLSASAKSVQWLAPRLSLTPLEDRITPDVKVFTSSVLAVQVGATYTGANAILDAANNALTLNGYYIVVDTANAPVGGYTAGAINKDLTIWGANHGIDPNTGVRVPEVFINTAASRFSVTTGHALTLDGFSFVTAGGLGAFFASANNYSLAFTNNIVKNQNAANVNGLQLGVTDVPGVVAATISHNLFDGMTTGSAIRISTSTNATITDNVILNGNSGMQIQASLPSVNGILINNNFISTMQLSAIRLEGNVNNPTVTNNTIINANLSNNVQHAGIRVATNSTGSGGIPGVAGSLTIQNNLITGSNTGIRFTSGTFADILSAALSRNAIDVNSGTSAVDTGNTADVTIDLSGNWLGTNSAAALEGAITGSRSYVIRSYFSGNANSRTGANSASSGVWGFSPNLATVEMLVPQTKATSLLVHVDGSIKSGIDLAVAGQRVRVASDTYTENVSTLANTVTLIANGQVTINGNMAFNGDDTIGVEVGGTNPATQFSNLVVNGTVNLGNAALAVSLTGGYVVPPGTFPSFTIFNNDGVDAVVGTFNGKPAGATFMSGGTLFAVTYLAGPSGNSVALQATTATPTITPSTAQIADSNTLVINGSGFSNIPGNNTVVFNLGAVGTVTSASATQLIVTFSVRPTLGNLTAVVTNNGNNSGALVQVATVVSIALSALPNSTVSQPYTPVVSATGGSGPYTFSLTSGTLPTGLTLNPNGTFSGTPTATGTYTFTLKATQSAYASGSRTYTVTINPAPSISYLTTTAWTQGQPGFTGTMTVTGGTPAHALFGTPTGVPPGLTAVLNGNTISFTGTPTTTGTFNGSIIVRDSAGASVTKAFSITINPAISFTPTALPNYVASQTYSQTISTTGGTGIKTVSLVGPLPAGLNFDPLTGILSGKVTAVMPAAGFTITFKAVDSVGATTTIVYTLKGGSLPRRTW